MAPRSEDMNPEMWTPRDLSPEERQALEDTSLFASSRAYIEAHKRLSRLHLRALMVGADAEGRAPAVIFDMLWPEEAKSDD